MKKRHIGFLTVVLGCLAASLVLGQIPAPGGGFTSTFAFQNVSGSAAKCTTKYYTTAGVNAVYTSPEATVNPNASQIVNVSTISSGSLPAGTYSAVIECDQPVAAVQSIANTTSEAAYRGVSSLGTTLYAPGIYNNYYTYYSNIVVQNPGTSNIDIKVEIFAPNNSSPVATQNASNVAPYASAAFSQSGLGGMNTNVPYSAKITAFLTTSPTTPAQIAAIVNIYGSGVSAPQLYSYNAFTSGGTTWYTPVNMNHYYGWNSAFVIQNIGTSSTSVTVNYSNGMSQNNPNLLPNSAWTIYLPTASPLSSLPPGNNILVGATITSSGGQPILVMVNESNDVQRAATYTGFTGGGASAYGPYITNANEVAASGYDTSITCQNVGTIATTMTLQYFNASGTSVGSPTARSNVAVGGTGLWYTPNDTLAIGFAGSIVVTTNNGQPIGCIINRSNDTGTRDSLAAYEAYTP